MKNHFNKILLLMICSSILCNCVSYRNKLFKGAGSVEQARKNAIIDFTNTYKTPRRYIKKRGGKPFNVFYLTYQNQSDRDLYVFSILPEYESISLGITDSLGKIPNGYFPNKFEVTEGKLFLWNDNITFLQEDILQIMDKYGVLDSIDLKRELGLLSDSFVDTRVVTMDDALKSVDYFMCKDNIGKYKKKITNVAFGYYDPPKLKCNTP